MATGSPSDVAGLLREVAESRPATLGAGRLVCVDGPAGSGKTSLAAALAEQTGAQVVHVDDLLSGWEGIFDLAPQLETILLPLAQGRPGSYRHFDWHQHRFTHTVEVPPAPWLVIEGVGSAHPVTARHTTLLAWVEADAELRFARGVARDGHAMEPHWRQWMRDEVELFARDGTRDRADVLVDGTGTTPPRVLDRR